MYNKHLPEYALCTLPLPYMGTWTLSLKTITDKGQWKKWHNFYLILYQFFGKQLNTRSVEEMA